MKLSALLMNLYSKTIWLLFILLSSIPSIANAQHTIDSRAWLSEIDDTVSVARLLIPGAHDAATGDGFDNSLASVYATTQDVGLRLQFESGVRAFDLRPVMHGDTMQIAHALFDTRLTFDQAIDIILSELDANPSEFAIILMRNENDTERGHGTWASLMQRCLNRVSNRLAEYSDTISVGQLRGKILLFSRDRYDAPQYGAYIHNWPDKPTLATCLIESNSGKTEMLVQDFYETTGQQMQIKIQSLEDLLHLSAEKKVFESRTWIANYASGYASTTPEGYSLSEGYRQNAASTSRALCKCLSAWTFPIKPSGLLFIDFAGVDHSEGYNVGGLSLTRAIIKANF